MTSALDEIQSRLKVVLEQVNKLSLERASKIRDHDVYLASSSHEINTLAILRDQYQTIICTLTP